MEVNKIINDIFKIVLNIILIIIAVTCSVQIFSGDFTSIGILYRLVIVWLCVFTIFNVSIGMLVLLYCCCFYLLRI